jgi:hypothetical protein
MDEYKTFEEMNKQEKITFLQKRYNHMMKCPCPVCLKIANESLEKIKEVEKICPDNVLHAIECKCQECLDKYEKVEKENE